MSKTYITFINPQKNIYENLRDVKLSAGLSVALAKRDITIRYVETILGKIWVIINPLINLCILVFVFKNIVNAEIQNYNYLLFVSIGLVVWNYFSSVVADVSNLIINSRFLIQKIYFPRIALVFSRMLVGSFELASSLGFVVIAFLYAHAEVSPNFLFFLPALLISLIFVLGSSLWIASISIIYRDFVHIVPVLLRVGIFLSPIGYEINHLDKFTMNLYFLNPITGLVEFLRWTLLKGYEFNPLILISIVLSLLLFGTGLLIFFKVDNRLADRL